jgi:hypothetical protein
MMEQMIAYCGLVCSDCPAYTATQAGDWTELERLAEKARIEYNSPLATAESTLCDGCQGVTMHKCGYCAECEIRSCGEVREVENCAACPDYACEKLSGFMRMVPEAQATLERIRAGL